MKRNEGINKVRAQIREEASEWLVAFCEEEVDAEGRDASDRWLRTSPEQIRAYLRISALWQNQGLLEKSRGADVHALVARARADSNVLPLAGAATTSVSDPGHTENFSHRRKAAIAACLLLIGAAAAGVLWLQYVRTPTYVTEAGEGRTVRLPDGSGAQLNARSRLEVHFSEAERRVDLVSGEVLFSVAKNRQRPFIVGSDGMSVRAVGTQFDVYRKRSGTTVTVVEGQVAVLPDGASQGEASGPMTATSAPGASLLVSAGEQAVVRLGAPMHSYRADVAAATAWTQGRLVFDSTPLREVVEEFNRTSARRLIVEDEKLLNFHISGVFPAADPEPVAGFLRQRFGVAVQESDEEIRIKPATQR
jgi:transmembrane sensor